MARIRIAKATSGAAFVSKKKATEARLAAQERGLEVEELQEDIFELQHHHLLQCLEKTTDREFVELEVPYNGKPNRPSSTPPHSPTPSVSSQENSSGITTCCAGRCGRKKKYQQHTEATFSEQEEELNDIQICMPNRTPAGDHSIGMARSNLNNPIPASGSNVLSTAVVLLPSSSPNSEMEAMLSASTTSTATPSPGNTSTGPMVRISTL